MSKRVLIVATVVKKHIMQFHIPTIKMLKDMGWEVDVAAKNDYENPEDLNIPYVDNYYDIPFVRSPLKKDNLTAYKKLKKIIDDGDYDVVHCHTPMGGFLTRLAAKDARKNGTKVFYTVHGFHFYEGAPLLNWLVYYPAEKYCSKYTDVIITICKEDYELAKHKMSASKIEFIPGIGIDVDKFKCDKNEINSDCRVILSVGELIKRKNHEIAIKALKTLPYDNWKYLIVGDGELKNHLQQLIDNYRLSDKISLEGYRNDVKKYYQMADIYIQPSYQEGMPVAVMEAMASGLPVIASDVRGNRDLIQKELLFNPDDSEEIARKIDYVMNADMKATIGRNRKVIKEYDQSNTLKKLKDIYESTTCAVIA